MPREVQLPETVLQLPGLVPPIDCPQLLVHDCPTQVHEAQELSAETGGAPALQLPPHWMLPLLHWPQLLQALQL